MVTEFLQNWGWLEGTEGFQARGCHSSTHHPFIKSHFSPAELPGRHCQGALSVGPAQDSQKEKNCPKKAAWQRGLPSWERGTRGAHPAGHRAARALPLPLPPVPGALLLLLLPGGAGFAG